MTVVLTARAGHRLDPDVNDDTRRRILDGLHYDNARPLTADL